MQDISLICKTPKTERTAKFLPDEDCLPPTHAMQGKKIKRTQKKKNILRKSTFCPRDMSEMGGMNRVRVDHRTGCPILGDAFPVGKALWSVSAAVRMLEHRQ